MNISEILRSNLLADFGTMTTRIVLHRRTVNRRNDQAGTPFMVHKVDITGNLHSGYYFKTVKEANQYFTDNVNTMLKYIN